jgi:hypothetical protein
LYTNSRWTMLTIVATLFETNYFIKTLLFCANFSRKIAKINISDQLTVMWYFLCTPNFRKALKTHVIKSFILFIKTLLFCANFSWKMIKIVFFDEVLYNIQLCMTTIPKMCVVHTVQTLCKKCEKQCFTGKKQSCTHMFSQRCAKCVKHI